MLDRVESDNGSTLLLLSNYLECSKAPAHLFTSTPAQQIEYDAVYIACAMHQSSIVYGMLLNRLDS